MDSINRREKKIRAHVIKEYVQAIGIRKVLCFTCGATGEELRDALADTDITLLTIGPNEETQAEYWYTPADIAIRFPGYFNATSGDLPMHLMVEIARRLRIVCGPQLPERNIKLGSGETALVLALAYPRYVQSIKPYRDGSEACAYDEGATLNAIIELLFGKDTCAVQSADQ